MHHEVELGLVIGQSGKNISETTALSHVAGYVLALDMTARDFQVLKKKFDDFKSPPFLSILFRFRLFLSRVRLNFSTNQNGRKAYQGIFACISI